MACPITNWSRWATRVLGDGIEAMSACLEGRSEGGVGTGTGWGRGVTSEGLWFAGAADACRRIEAAFVERYLRVETETDG